MVRDLTRRQATATTLAIARSTRAAEKVAQAIDTKHPTKSKATMIWQSQEDLPIRRMLMQNLMAMMQNRPYNQQDTAEYMAWRTRLPSVVRRIELALYVRAASKVEYANLTTLHRRVQFLIVTLHHNQVLQTGSLTPGKPLALAFKRSRGSALEISSEERAGKKHRVLATSVFTRLPTDLIKNVFGYLDGNEVVKCYQLNRYAHSILPGGVRTLSIPTTALQHLLDEHRAPGHLNLLATFSELESLDVQHRQTFFHERLIQPAMLKLDGDVPFDEEGKFEILVQQLAASLKHRSNPRLKKLGLTACFVHSVAGSGTGYLVDALINGACPKLEVLSLGNNCLGDDGAGQIARLVQSGACPNLQYLDLHRNYIGERGFKSLVRAIGSTAMAASLRALSLGGNLVTDAGIREFLKVLEKKQLRRLIFLGLEDNFIEEEGIKSLAAVLKRNVCPQLRELCVGENAVDNHVIHQIFCTLT